MKGIVYLKYGPPDVLKLEEIATLAPGDDEVLVRIYVSSVNPAEWHAMTGLLIAHPGNGLFKPKDL